MHTVFNYQIVASAAVLHGRRADSLAAWLQYLQLLQRAASHRVLISRRDELFQFEASKTGLVLTSPAPVSVDFLIN